MTKDLEELAKWIGSEQQRDAYTLEIHFRCVDQGRQTSLTGEPNGIVPNWFVRFVEHSPFSTTVEGFGDTLAEALENAVKPF